MTLQDFALHAAGILLGAWIGYRLAISAHVREKRHDFIVEQLRDFYSPMLTLRAEISSATVRCLDLRNDYFDPDQFFKTTWPLYRKMAALFSERLWLASPSTRGFHNEVLNVINGFQENIDNGFIENDYLRDALKEFERLASFYAHPEEALDRLQRQLLAGEK